MDLLLSASDPIELKRLQLSVVGTPNYVKVTCVLMFAQGLSSQVISNFLGIDTSTTYRYLDTYTSGVIDPLLGTVHKGYWGIARQSLVQCFTRRIESSRLYRCQERK